MAEDDIYHNKAKYEKFTTNIKNLLNKPNSKERKRKYWIKNAANIKHFQTLFKKFTAKDLSYIRRLRLCRTFLIACHVLNKDLEHASREDIDEIKSFSHTVNKSSKSKRDFINDTKNLWKTLFPVKDEKGFIDDSSFPYVVRHLSSKIDKSKDKLRGDKFSLEEFEKLIISFADDPRMQALLTISLESLSRPQEILSRKIKDVELNDNYAKIYITEHGKEGPGLLRVIDSYFYLSQWLNKHPLRKDPEAWLFINTGRLNRFKQMNPYAANKLIRDRCAKIGIKKPITLYSLKRNGVTMMRLQGKSDLDIQHTARWTSTKQLKTYDLSNQEESFKIELIKRGKIKPGKDYKDLAPKNKTCVFCGCENGLAESFCSNCKRPLDREVIEKEAKNKEKEIIELNKRIDELPAQILASLAKDPRILREALKLKRLKKF